MEAWMSRPDPQGLYDLVEAIVKTAMNDWEDAMIVLSKNPDSISAQNRKIDTERFFLSDYFFNLTSIDGEHVLNKLKGDFRNGEHYHGQAL